MVRDDVGDLVADADGVAFEPSADVAEHGGLERPAAFEESTDVRQQERPAGVVVLAEPGPRLRSEQVRPMCEVNRRVLLREAFHHLDRVGHRLGLAHQHLLEPRRHDRLVEVDDEDRRVGPAAEDEGLDRLGRLVGESARRKFDAEDIIARARRREGDGGDAVAVCLGRLVEFPAARESDDVPRLGPQEVAALEVCPQEDFLTRQRDRVRDREEVSLSAAEQDVLRPASARRHQDRRQQKCRRRSSHGPPP